MAEVRKLAFTDIEACLYRILEDSLEYLNSRNGGNFILMVLKCFQSSFFFSWQSSVEYGGVRNVIV